MRPLESVKNHALFKSQEIADYYPLGVIVALELLAKLLPLVGELSEWAQYLIIENLWFM